MQKALTFVGSKISESLQYQIPNHTNHTKFAKFRRDLPLLGAGDSSWSVEGAAAGDPGEQGGGGRERGDAKSGGREGGQPAAAQAVEGASQRGRWRRRQQRFFFESRGLRLWETADRLISLISCLINRKQTYLKT